MLSILASTAFGFLKGYAAPHAAGTARGFGDYAVGAVREELLCRAAPLAIAGKHLGGFAGPATSAVFALAHEPQSLGRFADVFAGGMLYHSAYVRYGLLGAVAAHLGHNLAIDWGASVARRSRTRSRYAR